MKYLFISHSASRAGGPISFLEIIKAVKSVDSLFTAEIVILENGDIVDEYRKFGKVRVLKYHNKWLRKIEFRLTKFLISLKIQRSCYDFGFANSSVTWFFIRGLGFEKFKNFFFRIPEGPKSVETILGDSLNGLVEMNKSGHLNLLVPSKANLKALKGFGFSSVHLLYGINRLSHAPKRIPELEKLKINNQFVGGSGRFIKQKGVSDFLAVAKKVSGDLENVLFVWLKAGEAKAAMSDIEQELMCKVKEFGLEKHILILPSRTDPESVYHYFDVFLMLSEWDSFPLVVLENAYYGVPTICYENAGGAPEFVNNDAGFTVPFKSIDAAAEKTKQLLIDQKLRNNFSKKSFLKVKNYSQKELANQLQQLLEING